MIDFYQIIEHLVGPNVEETHQSEVPFVLEDWVVDDSTVYALVSRRYSDISGDSFSPRKKTEFRRELESQFSVIAIDGVMEKLINPGE